MQANSYSIKSWAIDDRPREKLLKNSPAQLTNTELLAILINHGNREKTAIDLAREILTLSNNELHDLGRLSPHDFMKIKGIGEAKAITIAAALELGRRRSNTTPLFKKSITDSREIASFLKDQLQDLGHEVFAVVFLNRANRILHYEIISQGGITGTVADPRIILKKALEQEAVSLILCHNHPSGNLRPSKADEMLTQKIKDAGLLMDIRVMDHIIVSQDGYYSFADEGIL